MPDRGATVRCLAAWRLPGCGGSSFPPLAEKGDARAQYNLGLLYASGLGVTHDYQAALKWHRSAARQGHAGAQNALAQMYAKGHGIPQDNVRAHMWYSVAIG
ncbi:MAG: sel1 repeat family protein, partial [Nitrospira sp.]|nr:sel1 repeat family protein [Nitrospira sp.]